MRIAFLHVMTLLCSVVQAEQFVINPTVLLKSEQDIAHARKVLTRVQQDPNTCTPQMKVRKSNLYVGQGGVERASPAMLSVAFAMRNALETDQNLLNHLAAMIHLDLADENNRSIIPGEIGGVGFMNEASVEFLPVTNTGRYELTEYRNRLGVSVTILAPRTYNAFYDLPGWARDNIRYTFGFHLHATRDQPDFVACTPSFGIDTTSGSYVGDVSHTAGEALKFSTIAHEFVVGKHNNSTFSVTYIGAMMTEDEPEGWRAVVIPIGRYPM